jgi:hypothetical protein
MKKFFPYILSTCIAVSFSFIATENAFSQTEQKENKINAEKAKPASKSSYVTGLTSGRAKSLVGVVVGLISVIIGWRKARPIGGSNSSGRSRLIIAFVLGLIAILLSVVHLATTSGGFGTGGGKAGAIVGLVLGVIGTIRSGLVLLSKRKQNES